MTAADKGFTLLEVLLAITVLGVVVAMLSLSLGGTLRVVEATEQQEAAHHQAHTALRRLTADLASALQGGEIEQLMTVEQGVCFLHHRYPHVISGRA